ncbi:MAG: DNA gyrase subunit A [Candidatus Spyradenecus sp.]
MDDDTLAVPSNNDAHLVSVNVDEEMKNSYIDYSMSVIVARALPDARDGFKPVHRRVLYSMYETKNFYNGPYKKCARVVGDVMGKYHPHGDASIYDTLVRMAQWFSLRVPLVDGHGNFGTIDGDSAAAARYTECRMAKVANEMLADIDKETVDFMPNYDGLEQEPRVLPSKLPNLLLNGSQGIAVGMATNIPPHNLRELCEGLIYFVDHPEASIDELMQFVKGPDFPTGAQICGRAGIEAMYKLGRGSITVRGETEIFNEGKHETILITSIPYMVNKQAMITKMAELVKNGVIEGISDIRDETSLKDGIRVVIELKQNAKPASVILNQLYKHSDLQSTFGANMIALDHGRPRRMNLRDFFQCYVDHRFEVHTRRCRYELARAKERIHIVDGLLIAQDNLDEVIHIIRDSKTNEEAKGRLMTRFGFSDAQVTAILEMRLRQLTGLERDKLLAEQAALQARIAELQATLEDPALVFALIKADLEELREAYTKPNDRLTQIVPVAGEVNMEDLVADEPCVFTLSQRGYMKRTSLAEYAAQRRGGQGKRGVAIKEEDFIERVYVPMTHDTLLFFSDRGRAYAARVFDLREAARTTAGTHVSNLLEGLQKDERIVEILPIRGFDEGREITFVLEDGTIKRTALVAFKNINRRGIIAINIEPGNALVKVALTKPGDRVFMATREGFVNCFKIDEVRPVGRNAMGVCGMRFKVPGDRVCGFAIEEPEADLLFVTENGRGKRSAFNDFRETHRGSMGVIGNPRESEKNGKLVGIATVKGDETLVLLATNGLLIRTRVSEVRTMGRTAAGVNFVRLQEGASLATFSLAPAEETEEAPSAEGGEAPAPAETESAPTEPTSEA